MTGTFYDTQNNSVTVTADTKQRCWNKALKQMLHAPVRVVWENPECKA
jgi:hypothetical protein